MAEILVQEIEGANPFSISPAFCVAWIAELHTLESKGTERGKEVLHTVTARHPGLGHTTQVELYIAR